MARGHIGTGRVKLDDEIRDVRPLDAIRVAPPFEAGEDGLGMPSEPF